MYVIKKINEIYPDVEVNNIGESDFIVDYIKEKKKSTFVHETNYTEKFQPYSLWTT